MGTNCTISLCLVVRDDCAFSFDYPHETACGTKNGDEWMADVGRWTLPGYLVEPVQSTE